MYRLSKSIFLKKPPIKRFPNKIKDETLSSLKDQIGNVYAEQIRHRCNKIEEISKFYVTFKNWSLYLGCTLIPFQLWQAYKYKSILNEANNENDDTSSDSSYKKYFKDHYSIDLTGNTPIPENSEEFSNLYLYFIKTKSMYRGENTGSGSTWPGRVHLYWVHFQLCFLNSLEIFPAIDENSTPFWKFFNMQPLYTHFNEKYVSDYWNMLENRILVKFLYPTSEEQNKKITKARQSKSVIQNAYKNFENREQYSILISIFTLGFVAVYINYARNSHKNLKLKLKDIKMNYCRYEFQKQMAIYKAKNENISLDHALKLTKTSQPFGILGNWVLNGDSENENFLKDINLGKESVIALGHDWSEIDDKIRTKVMFEFIDEINSEFSTRKTEKFTKTKKVKSEPKKSFEEKLEETLENQKNQQEENSDKPKLGPIAQAKQDWANTQDEFKKSKDKTKELMDKLRKK